MKNESTFEKLINEACSMPKNKISKAQARESILRWLSINEIEELTLFFKGKTLTIPCELLDIEHLVRARNSADIDFNYLKIRGESFINFYEAYKKYIKETFNYRDTHKRRTVHEEMFNDAKNTLAFLAFN